MSQVTAIQLLAVLSTVLVVPVLSDCSRDGPADCDFEDVDVCNWSVSGDWYIYRYISNHFLSFAGENTGRLRSRLACPTGGSTHCLKFQYWFQVDNEADLNIIISNSETGEKEVWTMSSSSSRYNFVDAQVPIKTGDNFSVIIEVERHNGQNHSGHVAVDRIRYEKQGCSLHPSSATPATTTTATTHFDQGGTSGQTTVMREAHTESTSPATTPVTADQAASSQSQEDVVPIVGAVVGAIVVAIVVVVVLLVLFWKTCFKADKDKGERVDVTASQNVAYVLDLGDQGETSDMKMTAIDTEHRSPALEATAPSHSSDDFYNIIIISHKNSAPEPPNQMYAAVNKPRRPNPATANIKQQASTPLPSDQMYAALTKAHRSNPATTNTTQQQGIPLPPDQMYAAVTKAHRPNPGPQPTVTDPAQDSPYEIASDTPDCTAHQPAGDAAAGLYHCLEDDPETQPQLDTTDPYLAPDTLDTDTYTLDTDTYTLGTDTYTLGTDTYTLDIDTYTLDTGHVHTGH